MKQTLACLFVVASLSAAACSSSGDTASSLPAAPSTPLVTENFSGTIEVGASDTKLFTVTSSGFPITITLTTAGPPATITMGIGVGSIVGGTCQISAGTLAAAASTPQLSGTIQSGQYCFLIADVGNQSAPVSYTAVINHY